MIHDLFPIANNKTKDVLTFHQHRYRQLRCPFTRNSCSSRWSSSLQRLRLPFFSYSYPTQRCFPSKVWSKDETPIQKVFWDNCLIIIHQPIIYRYFGERIWNSLPKHLGWHHVAIGHSLCQGAGGWSSEGVKVLDLCNLQGLKPVGYRCTPPTLHIIRPKLSTLSSYLKSNDVYTGNVKLKWTALSVTQ